MALRHSLPFNTRSQSGRERNLPSGKTDHNEQDSPTVPILSLGATGFTNFFKQQITFRVTRATTLLRGKGTYFRQQEGVANQFDDGPEMRTETWDIPAISA